VVVIAKIARINSNTKSVEYRLVMRRGTHAKGRINNQFLITGFSITILLVVMATPRYFMREFLTPSIKFKKYPNITI
jgi:hypothetical protein